MNIIIPQTPPAELAGFEWKVPSAQRPRNLRHCSTAVFVSASGTGVGTSSLVEADEHVQLAGVI